MQVRTLGNVQQHDVSQCPCRHFIKSPFDQVYAIFNVHYTIISKQPTEELEPTGNVIYDD